MKIDISRFKCLIFDLDDTLVHSTAAYGKALAAIGVQHGDEDFKRARKEIKDLIGDGHVSARNRLLYFKKMLENQGRYSPELCLDLMGRYESALEKDISSQWQSLKRDDLFSRLAKTHVLGIISNENTRTQLIKMRAIDPSGKYFQTQCFSEDIGVEKPDVKIFMHFLNKAKMQPQECCFIGDNYAVDIVPAEKLGMTGILTREFVSDVNSSGSTISNLSDLLS